MNKVPSSWKNLILENISNSSLKSRTCCIFNNKATLNEPDKLCPCARLIRRHSYIGESVESQGRSAGPTTTDGTSNWHPPAEFLDDNKHSCTADIDVFGTLAPFGCKYLRIDSRIGIPNILKLIVDDCQGKPNLILSVYGGAKYFTMTERLEKEFIRGIIDAATMADAWILTAGINNGVSKLVGEGISHHYLLHEYSKKVKCIGMTMWGTINEDTRKILKEQSYGQPIYQRQIPDNAQEDRETIEQNHTHCILFDSGRLDDFLSDSHRHRFVTEVCKNTDQDYTCYAVTILVEGGLGSLEVIENDIRSERPIVLIQGSGRLADVLAALVEQTSNFDRNQNWSPSEQEIHQAFDRFYPNLLDKEIASSRTRILKLLTKDNRHLFHVFSLDRDKNVVEVIFKAIFTAKTHQNKKDKATTENENFEQEKQHRKYEDKLVDLALEWNYFDGVLPILQARQDEIARKRKEFIEDDINRQKELFRKSLEKNRPTFIEYFLSAGFDPLTLTNKDKISNDQSFILSLYRKSFDAMNKINQNRVSTLFGTLPDCSLKILDFKLNKLVGSYFGPIYSKHNNNFQNRVNIDLANHICICCTNQKYDMNELAKDINPVETKYTKHDLFRNLFLWSIFMDMPDMAKVLLLHVRSRICAALIASALFKEYAKLSPIIDLKDKFQLQSLEFETYAAMSLNKCYEYNEKRACELLLRQIPLFGNITCMQVAIASQSEKLLETACFDQTLNQVWFDKLALTNRHPSGKLAQIPSILTFGLLAPMLIKYREVEKDLSNDVDNERLSPGGIDYYITKDDQNPSKWKKYWKRFRYFHTSPTIKLSYHFISYIFFILVFSYMMLYHLDARDTFVIPHWTEIYVIITVSTMFCEEARRIYHDYKHRMVERWGSTGSTIVTVLSNAFYILPYLLFYIGLGFRYASYTDGLLVTARIIWALDLELWYLRSLKFVMALKFLGPKLFMLKNMLRDLFAFVYMIFIAIAAYGVVSRSLILYKQVPFTGRGIFSEIFYEPYWFIYGEVSDKDLLDNMINGTSDVERAEATATHVILAFHMLFINILLLNLLIAVFADSIGKVQTNTEFYWRYQRYSFVREYFELLPFGFPPLVLISHLILLFFFLRMKFCPKLFRNQINGGNYVSISTRITPVFKMIPWNESRDGQWDLFENAAAYSYARSILEKYKNKENFNVDEEKRKKAISKDDSLSVQTSADQRQSVDGLKDELISTLKAILTENQRGLEQNNSRLENRLDQMQILLESMTGTSKVGKKVRHKIKDPKAITSLGYFAVVVLWTIGGYHFVIEDPRVTNYTYSMCQIDSDAIRIYECKTCNDHYTCYSPVWYVHHEEYYNISATVQQDERYKDYIDVVNKKNEYQINSTYSCWYDKRDPSVVQRDEPNILVVAILLFCGAIASFLAVVLTFITHKLIQQQKRPKEYESSNLQCFSNDVQY